MAFDYDAELVRYQERLWAAVDVAPGDHVLDIGCGAGRTTREAARAASRGTALGIDVSAPMLDLARERAEVEGLGNVEFVQADAQTHPLPAGHFTVAISRFGTMFFADPRAAFANIGEALRPGARFVQLVWQARDVQEWSAAIRAAVGDGRTSSSSADTAFTLADPEAAAGMLTDAGFTAVEVVDVREPVYYGPDVESARTAVLQLAVARDPLASQDAAAAERALERLDATLGAHDTGNGVWFDARAWLISARRG